uniref:Uncharacterized protein n=1 Tax=Fagus sylvatica TaxID=28930 RepID=A0A2N9J3W3_FAGSY
MFFRMVKERSVRFSFRSGQRSGQTLVKLGQTLVEFGQSSPNSWKCIPDYISRVSGHGGSLVGLETARSNLGQTWSTLVKLGQTLGNVSRTFFLGVFDVARPSSDQAGLVRAVLVLRADTRENPVGMWLLLQRLENIGERLLFKDIPAVSIHLKREHKYHGKVKAFIDSFREAGIKLL